MYIQTTSNHIAKLGNSQITVYSISCVLADDATCTLWATGCSRCSWSEYCIRKKTRHATDVCPLVECGVMWRWFCFIWTFYISVWKCLNAHFACTCHNVHTRLHLCFSFVCILKVKLSLRSVLSADRVEQMTKTYNDVEVVTHLLAEVRVPSLATVCFLLRNSL